MAEKLSSFKAEFDVVSDGEFGALGFDLRQPASKTLTFAGSYAFLLKAVESPNVSAIITTKAVLVDAERRGTVPRVGIAIASDPRTAFFALHNLLCAQDSFYIKRQGFQRGENVQISPHASVSRDGVNLGDNVIVEDGVIIKSNVHVGAQTVIRAGTVIGGKGFQYFRNSVGKPCPVAHAGGVSIGNRVEIHATCAIDRHIFGADTSIGDDTKLDNHVQFAHGSRAGERCLIAAGAVISGSVRIGNDVWIGPNATVSDSIVIGDGASISLGAVVVRDIAAGQRVSGNFAEDHLQFLKRRSSLTKLIPPRSRAVE